jgi:paraquat-inducible protein A
VSAQSLFSRYPRNYEVPLIIALSAVCLGFGLFLPILTFKEMVFWKHTFSVLTGIESLYQERHYALAGIIFLFSVIFPIVKLTLLLVIWFWRFSESKRVRIVNWVSQMGKWSMLDVFVVAVIVVISKMAKTTSAQARVGVYIFAVSVLFAMIASARVERLAKRGLQNPKIIEA